jgi:hypothetical protein
MKMGPNALKRSTGRRPLLGLCFLIPFLIGGCPEFRDDVVSVFETATRNALLGSDDEWTIANATRVSLVDVTIDLIFDQFRSDEYE